MIATIIFACIIAALVTTVILNVKYRHDWAETASFVLGIISFVALGIFMVCLAWGYSNHYDEQAKDRRELIEYRIKYEQAFNPDTIDKIRIYNRDVDWCNNYFCRFTIKDNSIYLIDENVYLSKFNKQA